MELEGAGAEAAGAEPPEAQEKLFIDDLPDLEDVDDIDASLEEQDKEMRGPRIEAIRSLSGDSDPELEDAPLSVLEHTSPGALSRIFAVSKDTPKKVEVPFANLFKEEATGDPDSHSADTRSPRLLIQELGDPEPAGRAPPPSCRTDTAPTLASDSGDSHLLAASQPGGRREAAQPQSGDAAGREDIEFGLD